MEHSEHPPTQHDDNDHDTIIQPTVASSTGSCCCVENTDDAVVVAGGNNHNNNSNSNNKNKNRKNNDTENEPNANSIITTTTTTTSTVDASIESMRWLLLGDDDGSDHLMNALLLSSSPPESSPLFVHPPPQQQQHQHHHHHRPLNGASSDVNHTNDSAAAAADDDDDSVEDDGQDWDDMTCDDNIPFHYNNNNDENEDNDDLSSVMSDVGLLYDIDFDDYDTTTSKFKQMVVSVSLLPHQSHHPHHDSGIESTTTPTATATATHTTTHTTGNADAFTTKNLTTNTTTSSSNNDNVNIHHTDIPYHHRRSVRTTTMNQKDRKRRMKFLISQLHVLDTKIQHRQMYIQQIQHHRPKRLLQQIQQREVISSTLQRNSLVQEMINLSVEGEHQHCTVTDRPSSSSHNHADNSNPRTNTTSTNIQDDQRREATLYSNIYNFLLFEYYLTIPASIALLFHSIIMITIFDLVHDLVSYTYTDILPGMYKFMLWISSLSSLPQLLLSASNAIVGYIANILSTWLLTYYDTIFQIAMFVVGVYLIHLSGYLYWWLSDYDYTILKYDTHNRIRLLQWSKPNINNNIVSTSCTPSNGDNTSSNAVPSTSTITDTKWMNGPQYPGSSTFEHNHRNTYHNHVNTFVRRFYIVRKYPILRLVLYIFGYYILYMISQSIVAISYPYFSQHKTILPHLPSATFDKRYYHLVDQSTIPNGTVELHGPLVSNIRPQPIFPCLVHSCREEMDRQLHANHALIQAERQYTKSRLAYMSYWGYWSTFVELYGERTMYPLYDSFRNRFYIVNDDDDDDDDGSDDSEEENEGNVDPDVMLLHEDGGRIQLRDYTATIVDFDSTPVFDNMGEIVFGFVSLTIGIVLLRGYGFIFWHKY